MDVEREVNGTESVATACELLASLLLRAPSQDEIERIAKAFRDTETAMGDFARRWAMLEDDEKHREGVEITAEFSRLLLGMSGNPLFPYESAYVDLTPDPSKSARLVVTGEYAACGFKVSRKTALQPDHAGIELFFFADLVKAGKQREADTFASRHLNVWLPLLARDMRERAKTGFYQAVAASLEESCASVV